MNKYLAYPWSLLFGLYMYLLFQLMFILRFGRINTDVNSLDLYILVVGIASVLMLMYFARKLTARRVFLCIPFLIALPFSYIGALGGGLLGGVGVLIFGLVPFAIALPVGYWLINRSNKPSTPAM